MLQIRHDWVTRRQRAVDMGLKLDAFERWKDGACIQDVFPELSADDREFLLTGLTPEDWEKL